MPDLIAETGQSWQAAKLPLTSRNRTTLTIATKRLMTQKGRDDQAIVKGSVINYAMTTGIWFLFCNGKYWSIVEREWENSEPKDHAVPVTGLDIFFSI